MGARTTRARTTTARARTIAARALRPPDLATVTLAVAVAVASMALLLPASPSWGNEDAEAVLRRMASAEQATFQARQLVVYLGVPQSAAILDVRSTEQGTFVRAETGNEVTKLWRAKERGLITDDHMSLEDLAPPRVPMRVADVLEKYEIEVGTASEMLGVSTVPLELVRRSDRRLVERLWVDDETGIVYRRELLGPTGDLVGMSTVLDMRWGASERMEAPDASRKHSKVHQKASGDAPRELSYGYRLVRSYRMEAHGRPADHWVYSDGLHTLSVFRTDGTLSEPDDFEKAEVAGTKAWVGPGPGTWMWRGDGSTWVLVAEEPQLDAGSLIEPFPTGEPSRISRLGAWWARAWNWVADRFR